MVVGRLLSRADGIFEARPAAGATPDLWVRGM